LAAIDDTPNGKRRAIAGRRAIARFPLLRLTTTARGLD
jgi:hypothetical protein